MGGVHASCVEAWVSARRRANRVQIDSTLASPRCPVCRTRYGGLDRTPGAQVFARQLTCSLGRQLVLASSEAFHFIILGTLLVHYKPSGRTGLLTSQSLNLLPAEVSPDARQKPLDFRVAAAALFAFLLHSIVVLLVSLPPQRTPPRSRFARRFFFTADLWSLARHVAEILATVLLLGGRCLFGDLPLTWFAPVGILSLLPLGLLLFWYPPTACCREAAVMVACLFSAPLVLAAEAGSMTWRCRTRLLNPHDGPFHLMLAFIACILCLVSRSRRPVCILFALHSVVLSFCLLARFATRLPSYAPAFFACCRRLLRNCSRQAHRPYGAPVPVLDAAQLRMGVDAIPARLEWRAGKSWGCALLVAVEACSLAVEQRWLTLLLLLAALRALQRAAMEPPPVVLNHLLLHGPLWWCSLLVAGEATGLLLRELRHGPTPWAQTSKFAALGWLVLLAMLACSVNWGRYSASYRRWQRRHATFVLLQRVPPHNERSHITEDGHSV